MLLTEVPKIWQQWADIQCRARTALLLALKPVDDLSSVEIYLEIALFFGRDFALKMETTSLMDVLVTGNVTNTTNPTSSGPTDAQKYGFGTLAVVIISICPIISVVIVGFKKSFLYKFVISAMLGLCVGSLVGDSLLHLVPQILGAHGHQEESHEEGEDEEGHEEHNDDKEYIWKMLVSCVSVWAFIILQMVIQGVGQLIEAKKEKKEMRNISLNDVVFSNNAMSIDTLNYDKNVAISPQIGDGASENVDKEDNDLHVHAHSSVAWMVTIGDALHNFTDGLAIGAAFSKSLTSGLAISIAVLCHELPHEFGDAALMLSAGWSYKLVLLLQFLAQVTAFIGLYIGIALSNAFEDAQIWIFSIAAGMFLYVALSDAVPEIMELVRHYKSVVIAFLSNIGVAVGFVIMILLAVYEENIVIH